MRKDWEVKPFESCIEKVAYTRKVQKKHFLSSGMYPIISQEEEYINGYWDKRKDVFKIEKPITIFGDHTKVLKYVEQDFVLGADGVKILQTKDFLDEKFFYHLLHSIYLKDLGYARHYRLYKEMVISFPVSLEEQKEIVRILDEAFDSMDRAKEATEKNLKNARELFESYLNNIFTNKGKDWEEKKLGEIANVRGGKRVPKGFKLEVAQTDYPYIRVADFSDNGTIDLNGIKYVSEDVYLQIKNYTISPHDLYISIAGTIGKSGIIPKELDGANLTENACKLVFEPCIDNKFVYYFTITESFLEQAGLNTRVSAMPKLALARLATIVLNVPSISEQKQIVKKLDKLSTETKKLEAIYEKKLVDLEELKKSILEKAFSGELTKDFAKKANANLKKVAV